MTSNVKETINYVADFGVIPVVVGIANGAVAALGRSFLPLNGVGAMQMGVLGGAQALGANLLMNYLYADEDEEHPDTAKRLTAYFFSHIISGGTLFALTALAVKVGLIASTLTLPGAAVFILANFAVSVASAYILRVSIQDFQQS